VFEKDLNHDLTKLFASKGWAYKIPDPAGITALSASQRPFDGFAAFPGFDFFYESKLIKNKVSAFSIARVEPHQFANLLKLRELGKETAVVLGIWIPRSCYKILLFDPMFLYTLDKKSLNKKCLEAYVACGYAIDMRKPQDFWPEQLLEIRINKLPGRGND
jgi:hypothetical protein